MLFSILISIINTILDSVDTILFKKAISIAPEISSYMDRFISYIGGNLIVGTALLAIGFGDISSLMDAKMALMLIFYSMFGMIGIPLEQSLYRNEKMSILLLYSNVGNLIVTLFAFFFFGGVSVLTFFLAIITIVTVMLFSFDFRELSIPKYLPFILLNQLRRACQLLFLGYLLQHITNYTLFIYENYFWGLQLIMIIFAGGLFHVDNIRKLPKTYFAYRLPGVWFGAVAELLGYLIIGSVGIIFSILLGFFGVGLSLILAYVLMKEVPTKKEIFQNICVTILALIGIFVA